VNLCGPQNQKRIFPGEEKVPDGEGEKEISKKKGGTYGESWNSSADESHREKGESLVKQ